MFCWLHARGYAAPVPHLLFSAFTALRRRTSWPPATADSPLTLALSAHNAPAAPHAALFFARPLASFAAGSGFVTAFMNTRYRTPLFALVRITRAYYRTAILYGGCHNVRGIWFDALSAA